MLTELSTCAVDSASGVFRDSPRPKQYRGPTYDEEYDWTTLFFDVYRVDDNVVFQGPPLFSWWPLLRRSAVSRGMQRLFMEQRDYIERPLGGEIWVKAQWEFLTFCSALGDFELKVQPNLSELFEGRRVMFAMSQDNDIAWIEDWIAFHRHLHGADGVLVYDNRSTNYSAQHLQATLRTKFPDMVVHVVPWPSLFGPWAYAVEGGGETRRVWDSNFGKFGALQHARFRFLGSARSVLSCDIDELVIGEDDASVFEAAESAASGIVLFEGRWIGQDSEMLPYDAPHRHNHFRHLKPNAQSCPSKWCVRPGALDVRRHAWNSHWINGAKDMLPDQRFNYRHFWAVSTAWRSKSRRPNPTSTPSGELDDVLMAAFERVEAAERLRR